MASRKKPLITFSKPAQPSGRGQVGILMTCGARTISLVRNHKIIRLESGLNTGVDRADYHPSEPSKIAYIKEIKYTLPNDYKEYEAKLVDAKSGHDLDTLNTLTIELIER